MTEQDLQRMEKYERVFAGSREELADMRALIAEVREMRGLLGKAREACNLADGAFTKNWAVDWDIFTEVRDEIDAALGEMHL